MKFLSLFVAGVAAQTNLEVINAALQAITDANTALQAAVAAYTPGGDINDLATASFNVLDAINTGNTNVAPVAGLTFQESISLTGPVNDLATGTENTIDALVGRRADFVANCLGTIVYNALTETFAAAQTFSATLRGKVDTAAQPAADVFITRINTAFQEGIAAYQDQATPPCECGGDCTSTTTTTTSTTSGTTSGTTTTTTSGTATTTTTTTSSDEPGQPGPTYWGTWGVVTTVAPHPTTTGGPGKNETTTSKGGNGGNNGWYDWEVVTSGKPTTTQGPSYPGKNETHPTYTTSKGPVASFTGAAAPVLINFGALAAAAAAVML